jgi:hypothetical protein
MMSFCVTSKDRYSLFANCVDQLKSSVDKAIKATPSNELLKHIELVVADWYSKDVPVLRWLPAKLQDSCITTHVVYIPRNEPFSRGRGLNIAAAQARFNTLFFIDTDMLIPHTVILNAAAAVHRGRAYFPICWSYRDPRHKNGRWRVNGKGVVAVGRRTYEAANKWDELTQWGTEDVRFYERTANLVRIDRYQCPGLFHQWHTPSSTATR